MQKHLQKLLLIVAMMVVPWVTQGQAFHYTCNFDNDSDTAGWVFVNGSQANNWYIGSATSNGGTKSLYVSNDNGTSNAYTNNTVVFVYATKDVTLNAGSYVFTYDWKAYGESNYDYIRVFLAPSTLSLTAGQDPSGGTSAYSWRNAALPTGCISLCGPDKLNLQSVWQNFYTDFNITTAGTYKLVFAWANDGSGGSNPPAAIDNIYLSTLSCFRPVTATSSNVTNNSFDFAWTDTTSTTSWHVQLSAGATTVYDNVATTTSVSFTGLSSNTIYTARVAGICQPGDTSAYRSITVQTLCGDVDTLPITMGFESSEGVSTGGNTSTTFVNCWHRLNNGTQYFGYPYVSSSSTYNHTPGGSRGLYWFNSTTTGTYGDYQVVVLPGVNTTNYNMSDLRLTFWAKVSSSGYNANFLIGVMTDPTDINTFTQVSTVNVHSTAWGKFNVDLSGYTGSGRFVAIRTNRASSSWYVYMDDITLATAPDCPEVSNIVGSNPTTSSFDISWTENGTATSWTIEYGVHGFTPGSGITETVSTLPHTIYGLNSNTEYDVYITPDCMGTSVTEMFSYRTECDGLDSLPYTMGFESSEGVSTGGNTSTTFVNCWHRLNNGTDYFGYPYVSSSSTYNHTPGGSRGLYWYNNTTTGTYGDYMVAVLPPVNTSIYTMSDLRVTFWAKASSTSYHPVFQVGVMTDPTDITTFTTVGTVNVSNSTSWDSYTVSLSSYVGTGNYVAIRANRASSSWYAYMDDISLLPAPDCPEVSHIVFSSVTDSSAYVNWTETGSASSWVIEYGVHGFTPGTGTSQTVSSLPHLVSGLNPNTEYDVYVTPDCSGTTITQMASFRTECLMLDTLPYFMGFESSEGVSTGSNTSANFINCWHHLNNGTTYFGYPHVSSSSSYNHTPGGSRGLYWYNTTTTGTYGDYQIVVLPGVNPNAYSISSLQLTFWARATSTSYHPTFQVGVMTDPNDAATFQTVATVNVEGTTYQEFTASLGSYTGTGCYPAIRATRPTSSWYASVDDILLEPLPSCPAIENIEVAAATPGSALLTWGYMAGTNETPAAFQIIYDSIGGTTPDTVVTTDAFYAFANLEPGTSYKARLRAQCSSTSFGAWDSITFSTADLRCSEIDETTVDTVIFSNSTDGVSGCLAYSSWGNTAYQTIYTAAELTAAGLTAGSITGIDLGFTPSTSYNKEFTIFIGNTSTTSISNATLEDPNAQLQVYGPALHPMNTTGWQHYEFETPFTWDGVSSIILTTFMNQPTGSSHSSSSGLTGYYVSASNKARYRYKDSSPYTLTDYNSGSGGSTYSYRAAIHFYTGECISLASCAEPRISIVNTDTASIDVAWAPGYMETSWDLDYRTSGSSTWTSVATNISTNYYSVTGLTPGTVYDFRVSHTCDTTLYYDMVSGHTQCVPPPVPFTVGFEASEGWTSGTAGTVPGPCWTKYTNYSTNYYPYVSSTAHSGSQSMYMYLYTYSSYLYFTLPTLEPSLDSLMVSFWAYKSSSSYPDNVFQVGVMSDPNDYSTFIPVGTFCPESYEWKSYDVMLNNYTGPAGHIAFAVPVQSSSNAYYSNTYIDDIVVDYIPSCPHVTDVHTQHASGDTLTLAWTPVGQESEWEVSYNGNVLTTNDDTIQLTGIRPSRYYEFAIRAICSSDDTSTAYIYGTYSNCGKLDSLPYTQDFEHVRPGSSTTYTFAPCWTINTDATSYPYVYVSSGSSYNHTPDGNKGVYWYRSTSTGSYGTYQAIVLPEVDTNIYPANNLMLTFWAKPSSMGYEPVFYAGIMSDPNFDTTFYYYDTIRLTSTSTAWQKYTVRFDGLPDSIHGSYVALRSELPTSYWYAYVDDITLNAIPDCEQVEDIVVEAGPVSATVTWTVVDPGYQGATVEYRDSSSSWTSVTVTGVNHASITGLTPGTEYELRVFGDCSAGPSLEATTTFTTPLFDCHAYDSTSLINVTIGNTLSGTSSNYIPSYSTYNYGYTQQFYTAHEIGSAGQITRISVMPTAVAQQRTYEIYMGYSSDSSASSFITPSHMSLVYNDGHIPLVANQWLDFNLTFPFNYNPDSGNLVVIFRDLTGSWVGGNAFLTSPAWTDAARYEYRDSDPYTPGSVTDGTSLSERNVMKFFGGTCLEASTCAAPPMVVTAVGSSTVDVAWTPGNTETSWNLYYRPLSEDNFTSAAMGVNTTSYQFTGLMGGTQYEFMIVPVCADSLSNTVRATTECAAITALPYTEDFNNWGSGTGVIPNCWFRTGTYSTYTYISTSYNHSGSTGGSIYMYSSTGSLVSYLVLPELDSSLFAANQTQLVFYAYLSSTSYAPPAFEVGVMEDPHDATTFVPVDTVYHNGVASTWNIFEVPLANYTGTGVNVAVRTLYNTNYTYPYIDDFTLELIPTCPRPDSLEVANATTSSVDLNWHERGLANQWIVEYGPAGFQLGTGTTVLANSNPFTLTGLPASYQGEYYVRSICGAGDTGEYSRIGCPFNTCQNPATIPYSYNFEDAAEWNNWQTSSNSTTNWFRGTTVADSGSYSMYVSADSGATYRPYTNNAVVNAAVYRDVDFGSVDTSFTITFRARVGGTFDYNYDGLMVFLVDPSIPTTPSTSNITSPWGNVNDLYRIATVRRDTNWVTYSASFDTIHGIKRVAFFWFNQNTSTYANYGEPAAVDNISIDYSSCPRPVNLTANTNTETARLSWQGPATGNYEITYRPYPNGTTNTIVYSSTNWVMLTGLSPLTQYAFWVRQICGAGDTSLYSDGELFTTEMCENGSHTVNYTSSMTSTTSSYSPIGYSTYNYSYVQTIIDSAYMANLNGDITAFSFVPASTTAGTYFTKCTVYMANVPESNLNSGFIHPDTTNHIFVKVIDSIDLSYTTTDEQIHGFDTTFTWDGHSNVLFAVNRQHGSWTSGSSFQAHSYPGSDYKMRYVYNDGSPYNPATVSGGTTSNTVGDITLYACAGVSCSAPDITSVNQTYHSATVFWMGDGTDYEVNIKESAATDWLATDIAVAGTSYTFNGLSPATSYTFRVRQDCSADSMGYSDWIEAVFVTDSLPCLPPDSLHATAVTNATATFDWSVNGNENVWDIHVWYGSFDSTYRTILRPATVGGFTAGLTYNAAIRAVCGVDMLEGDWSDTVQFTTAVCPDITGLTTSNVTTNSVTLNWNSNPMALRWNIEYGPTGFTQGQGTQAVSNTNSYVVTGLSDGITYDFYVKAVCGDDWTSENWVGTSATTQEGTIPCDAPTGVGTAVADNSVTVNWTAGAGNISFELEYGPRGFSHGAGSTTTATGSPAVIANLDYETQYDVYVRAVCEQNIFSPWSAVSTFTTGERPSEDCDPVQNLTVTNVTETSADISWQPGPTGDHWQVVLTDGTGSTISDNVTAERQATFSNLTPGTNYTVKVRTDCGDGNYSAYVTANFRTLGGEGIEEVEGINCRIFPNPATSSTTISVSGVNGMVRIAVVDMNGRTVATETLECSADCEKTMEVDKLAQGAYFVRITADNTNMVRKLIVR